MFFVYNIHINKLTAVRLISCNNMCKYVYAPFAAPN